MPHKEKIAWLSLFAMAITFGPYFIYVAADGSPKETMPNLHLLLLFAATAIAQTIILGCGHLYLRLNFPEEARLPYDERDLAIKSRSIKTAYYVLIVGMILVGCVMPFNSGGWQIINATIFMIVVSETVHNGMIVFSYRRQIS